MNRLLSSVGFRAMSLLAGLMVVGLMLTSIAADASAADDRRILAALDTQYQKAVQDNDTKTMAAILADDFILVEGDGKRSTKADLVNDAASGKTHYEHQQDTEQTVIVSGDTAVVTAKLWAKGIEDGVKVDYEMWFSDVYVRTPKGWSYLFGQASLPLPSRAKH
jgi:ketosteroid isomerase-like protein